MTATTHAYYVRHRNGWATGFGPRPTHCHECGADLPPPPEVGYGCGPDEPIESHPDAPALRKGESLERSPAICYACCGARDRARMIENGRIVLYLDKAPYGCQIPVHGGYSMVTGWRVMNWSGSLVFPVSRIKASPRAGGFGASRMDAWFIGPDGFIWHAINRGDDQIARCRRTKARAP